MFIGIVSAQSLLQQNQDSRSKAAEDDNGNERASEPTQLSITCGKSKGDKVEATFRWKMTGPKPESMWIGIDKDNLCNRVPAGNGDQRIGYPCPGPNDTGDLEFKLPNSSCKSGTCKYSKYLVKNAPYKGYAISALHKSGRLESRGGSFTCN